MTGIEKWSAIYQTINENKIAILATQETHLNRELLQNVNECFGKRLAVVNSQLQTNPRSSAGVAFVINKSLLDPKEITTYELIEGRAIALKIKWHENDEIVLINVYAPNDKSEHRDFWEQIDSKRRAKNLRCPDFMLGDFNLTEDQIDRSPAHLDDTRAIEALRNLRQCLNLQDSWRHQYPNERSFTYRANVNGQHVKSRIDRIYTSAEAAKFTFNWRMKQSSVPTDHWLVIAKYAPTSAPYIGKGRWTWQKSSLEDEDLMEKVDERGLILQNDLESIQRNNTPRDITNPQQLWSDFKDDITSLAKTHGKESCAKISKKIKAIEKDLKSLTNHPDIDNDETLRTNEAFLANELTHLEKIKARDRKDDTRAALSHHGEKLGGPWSAINREKKPRDLIYRLKVPESAPTRYERDTKRMADMARDYHHNLQSKDITLETDSPERKNKTRAILNEIPQNQVLSPSVCDNLDWTFPTNQVMIALKLAKNGTATGLDGCPYELWKALDNRFERSKAGGKKSFDVTRALAIVFSDIQSHGVSTESNFAQGWMCPIYKKKDTTEISNYRPITLLNTDYKLLTKTMALLLMKPIHSLIHPDQAGFIPKRQIFDHIRLAKTVLTYAETMEVDGVIVALDQEKAYDRIRHHIMISDGLHDSWVSRR